MKSKQGKVRSLRKYSMLMIIICFCTAFIMLISTIRTLSKWPEDLSYNVSAKVIHGENLQEEFIEGVTDFSIEMFKEMYVNSNMVLSPVAALRGIALLSNGAKEETRDELLELMPYKPGELNLAYCSLMRQIGAYEGVLVEQDLSLWLNDDYKISADKIFLQTNKSYYNASVYKTKFKEAESLEQMTKWLKKNSITKELFTVVGEDDMMRLFTRASIRGEWRIPYGDKATRIGTFSLGDDSAITATFAISDEVYIGNKEVDGIIKPYKDGCSFVALLPKEDRLEEYIKKLDGKSFLKMIESKDEKVYVAAQIPLFSIDNEVSLTHVLKNEGLIKTMDSNVADFIKIGTTKKSNLALSQMIEQVNIGFEMGVLEKELSEEEQKQKEKGVNTVQSVVFDRPFLYAIIDDETNLPLFIGTVMKPSINDEETDGVENGEVVREK